MMSIPGANEKSNLTFENGNNTEQQQCSSWVIYEKIPMGLGSTWGKRLMVLRRLSWS